MFTNRDLFCTIEVKDVDEKADRTYNGNSGYRKNDKVFRDSRVIKLNSLVIFKMIEV